MKIYLVGNGPIANVTREVLHHAGHTTPEDINYDEADVIVWCRGNDTEWCITRLAHAMESAPKVPFVVVTSEHGSIPTANPGYHNYAAVKAGQKMLCQAFVRSGGKCVDVSPAFVKTEDPTRRINNDTIYRNDVENACNDTYPIEPKDVAEVILFAAENCGMISGTVIRVSAGWQDGGIY